MRNQFDLAVSRRAILRKTALGFAALGLDGLLASEPATSAGPLAPKQPHFPARAKRVIFLFMHGGVSHIDSFDPKPRLIQDNGKPMPIKRRPKPSGAASRRSIGVTAKSTAMNRASIPVFNRRWRNCEVKEFCSRA